MANKLTVLSIRATGDANYPRKITLTRNDVDFTLFERHNDVLYFLNGGQVDSRLESEVREATDEFFAIQSDDIDDRYRRELFARLNGGIK